MNRRELAKYIDHTNLKATATRDDIIRLCDEAVRYEFTAVCINPVWIPDAAKRLETTSVKVCTVVGFPLGACRTAVKVSETRQAVDDGADEIDMVINIGALLGGDMDTVRKDIREVVAAAYGKFVKVIFENCYLSRDQKIHACRICLDEAVDFVKTSTGFGPSGATTDDVKLMHEQCRGRMKVKAAGGIRCLKDALAMIEAGAERIGTSSGVQILIETET